MDGVTHGGNWHNGKVQQMDPEPVPAPVTDSGPCHLETAAPALPVSAGDGHGPLRSLQLLAEGAMGSLGSLGSLGSMGSLGACGLDQEQPSPTASHCKPLQASCSKPLQATASQL